MEVRIRQIIPPYKGEEIVIEFETEDGDFDWASARSVEEMKKKIKKKVERISKIKKRMAPFEKYVGKKLEI